MKTTPVTQAQKAVQRQKSERKVPRLKAERSFEHDDAPRQQRECLRTQHAAKMAAR